MKLIVFGALLVTALVLSGCTKTTTTNSPGSDSGDQSATLSTTQNKSQDNNKTATTESEQFAIYRPDLGFAVSAVSITAKEETSCPPRCLPSNALTNYVFEPLGIGAVTLEAFGSVDAMINSGSNSYTSLPDYTSGLSAENNSETNISKGKIVTFETPAQSTIPRFVYALIISDSGSAYQISGANPALIQEISQAFVLL